MGADGNTTIETNGDVKHCYHKILSQKILREIYIFYESFNTALITATINM